MCNSNNSCTFVVLNHTAMKTNVTYLVKEKHNGFGIIKGTLVGDVFKSKDRKFKLNTRIHILSKDERFFTDDMSARIHADMLNHVDNN